MGSGELWYFMANDYILNIIINKQTTETPSKHQYFQQLQTPSIHHIIVPIPVQGQKVNEAYQL